MPKKDLASPPGPKEFKVDLLYDGRRLDKFVAHRLPRWSRTLIQKKIRLGEITRNDKPAKPNDILRAGDKVTIISDAPKIDLGTIPLRILYEDDDFVAVDKDAGIIVHPAGREMFGTIINVLHFRYREKGQGSVTPLLCHRLDRETSGVLLVAKNVESRRYIQNEFESGRVHKEYLAIVEGIVKDDAGVIEGTLRKAKTTFQEKPKMEVNADSGHPSKTEFAVLERFAPGELVKAGATFLRASPKTGRTHQIRAHLASIGHPVLCDKVYGNIVQLSRGGEIILSRQALHSNKISFKHLPCGEMEIASPLAADIAKALNALRSENEKPAE